jgi:hypothetical protein
MKRQSSRFIKIRHVLFWDANLYIDKCNAILLWFSYRIKTTGLPEGYLVVLYYYYYYYYYYLDGRIVLRWIFRKLEGLLGLDGVGSV